MESKTAFVPNATDNERNYRHQLLSKSFRSYRATTLEQLRHGTRSRAINRRCYVFHLHEVAPNMGGGFSPDKHGGITTNIGLMVDDVHMVLGKAV